MATVGHLLPLARAATQHAWQHASCTAASCCTPHLCYLVVVHEQQRRQLLAPAVDLLQIGHVSQGVRVHLAAVVRHSLAAHKHVTGVGQAGQHWDGPGGGHLWVMGGRVGGGGWLKVKVKGQSMSVLLQ